MQVTQTPMLWMMKSRKSHDEFYCGTAVINQFQLDADQSELELFTLNATGDGEIMIDNPYLIKLLQGDVPFSAIGSMGNLIGYLETSGLPPFNDEC
jgi:hypothetical protein